MSLTDFTFSYPHETTTCQLSTRNFDTQVCFYLAIDGPGRGKGRRDIALTTRVSVGRIVRKDIVDAASLARELFEDIYSHGEPQRRKPQDGDSDCLVEALVAWIRRNRGEVPGTTACDEGRIV